MIFITLNEVAIAPFIIRADPISAEWTIIPPNSNLSYLSILNISLLTV